MLLREVEPQDVEVLYEHQADPESGRMASVPSRDRRAHEEHLARLLADPDVLVRTVVADDGRVAGQVLSFPRDGVREVGYRIGREYWGRGLATAALAAFLDVDRVRPLHGVVAEHNPASRRVLERNGFAVVGRHEAPALEPGDPPVPVLVLRLDA
jgi:RimJ/RimL family protein N-acetyltransferase